MTDSDTIFAPALEGIVVGETGISNVRGDIGELSYRGTSIEQLVEQPIADVILLLLTGEMPNAGLSASFADFLLAHSELDEQELAVLNALPSDLHPMQVLQAIVPVLASTPRQPLPFTPGDDQLGDGLVIAAKIPSILAYWFRRENGLAAVEPLNITDPIERFLYQLHGSKPAPEAVATLNAAQILQLEHSYNAGTFAGRVCASTDAPIASVIAASIGTLYGKLHGGADQAALEMAKDIGSAEAAPAYVRDLLGGKQKIMGMGHREYKTVDPRAKLLKPMAARVCLQGEAKQLYDTLLAIEETCQEEFERKGKQIWANVEFYKGAVFYALGIPTHYFTAMFAMARVYGYIAHFDEFRQAPRLIRPTAKYVGS